MKSHHRVVVIGGGVVGASVARHLAKFGRSDVVVIERSVLTAGSSWHAVGGIHALDADPNMAALQAYTMDLLTEIERESGQNIGLHMTGGITVASAPARCITPPCTVAGPTRKRYAVDARRAATQRRRVRLRGGAIMCRNPNERPGPPPQLFDRGWRAPGPGERLTRARAG